MPLETIDSEDPNSRTKINAAIDKANELDTNVGALQASVAGYGTAAQSAATDFAASGAFDVLAQNFATSARGDPGLAANLFTENLAGKAADNTPIAIGAQATSDDFGTVWLIAGADVSGAYIDVAPRDDWPLRDGRVYRVRMALERFTNPSDPLNDAVEVRNITQLKDHTIEANTLYGSPHDVRAENPPLEVTFTVGKNPPTGVTVDFEPDPTAIYHRPFFRIYGGAPHETAVAYITREDVTDAEVAFALINGSAVSGISGYSADVSTPELGTSVTPTLTWSLTGTAPIASITMNGSPLAIDAEEYTAPAAITADTTYTLVVTDTNGGVSTEAVTVDFRHRGFWGVSSATSLDSAAVIALANSALITGRDRTMSITAADEYLYYAYPTAFGAPTDVKIFGFSEPTSVQTTVSVTTAAGHTEDYTVIRSPFPLTDTNIAFEVD